MQIGEAEAILAAGSARRSVSLRGRLRLEQSGVGEEIELGSRGQPLPLAFTEVKYDFSY
jgi:hypothetical protein